MGQAIVAVLTLLPIAAVCIDLDITPAQTFREGSRGHAELTCSAVDDVSFVACVWFAPDGTPCAETAPCKPEVVVSQNSTACSMRIERASSEFRGTWSCRVYTVLDFESTETTDAETQIYFVNSESGPPELSGVDENIVFLPNVESRLSIVECIVTDPSPLTR